MVRIFSRIWEGDLGLRVGKWDGKRVFRVFILVLFNSFLPPVVLWDCVNKFLLQNNLGTGQLNAAPKAQSGKPGRTQETAQSDNGQEA